MPQPYKLFTIYAREDAQYLEELRGQLRPLENAGRIKVWSDREINPGVEWEKEIVQNLDTADIILILVSAAYYNSAYIHEVEIKYALSRHERGEAKVLPIIVRPCSFEDDPVISRLQVLPTDGKPVTDRRHWQERDDAWLDVVAGVKRTIEIIRDAENRSEQEIREAAERERLAAERKKEEEKRTRQAETDARERAERERHQVEQRTREEQARWEHEAKQRGENERLVQLRREQGQTARRAELDIWQQAADAHNIPAYENYLARYPQGEYTREARFRIKELKRKDAKPVPWVYFIAAGVIVIIIFFGVRLIFPNLGKSSNNIPTQTSTSNDQNASTDTGKSGNTFTPLPFNYSAPSPIGGKLKGVVELGATGFNSFIIRIDDKKNWKLWKAEFGVSLVKENPATDEDIKAGLKRFIADMVAYSVNPRDIHFVVSSGAAKEPLTQKIGTTLKSMGYFVNEITPQQEARLALRAALPNTYQNKAFVVDISSGNTKISWLPDGALVSYGAKYYQDNTADATVYQDAKSKSRQIPANLRGTCFIIGGVPYELAKQVRNGIERYTVLKAPADYTPDGAKQKSGLNIYQAIADATGCKQFVFDWDANFTIGFLLNL